MMLSSQSIRQNDLIGTSNGFLGIVGFWWGSKGFPQLHRFLEAFVEAVTASSAPVMLVYMHHRIVC